MMEGSPIWQGGLLLFAALFLAFETWRGWRAGFARAGINFAAIVIGTMAGLFAAHMAAAPFGGFKDPAGFLSALVIGGGLGLFVFLVLWLTGIIFFKRTDHQATGIFRLFWGTGGSFFGFLMGLLILWGGISVIRSLGALARVNVESAQTDSTAAPAAAPAATPRPLAVSLLKLKESLELGPAGKFVESVDVIPTEYYELIAQIGLVSTDQHTLMRFLEYPSVQEVLQSPQMAALTGDPDVIKAANGRNFAALFSNPKVISAVQDPALAEKLKKVDLRAAMKYALEKPAPEGAPTPKPQ